MPREQADLTRTLADQWPVYAAHLVSFLTIGIIWVNHHTLLEHIRRVDRRFLYLNLLPLLSVAVVPFPTAVVGANTSRTLAGPRPRSSFMVSSDC